MTDKMIMIDSDEAAKRFPRTRGDRPAVIETLPPASWSPGKYAANL